MYSLLSCNIYYVRIVDHLVRSLYFHYTQAYFTLMALSNFYFSRFAFWLFCQTETWEVTSLTAGRVTDLNNSIVNFFVKSYLIPDFRVPSLWPLRYSAYPPLHNNAFQFQKHSVKSLTTCRTYIGISRNAYFSCKACTCRKMFATGAYTWRTVLYYIGHIREFGNQWQVFRAAVAKGVKRSRFRGKLLLNRVYFIL